MRGPEEIAPPTTTPTRAQQPPKGHRMIPRTSVEPRRWLHPRARRPGRAARSRRAQTRAEPAMQPENVRVPVRGGCRASAGWEHAGLTPEQ